MEEKEQKKWDTKKKEKKRKKEKRKKERGNRSSCRGGVAVGSAASLQWWLKNCWLQVLVAVVGVEAAVEAFTVVLIVITVAGALVVVVAAAAEIELNRANRVHAKRWATN